MNIREEFVNAIVARHSIGGVIFESERALATQWANNCIEVEGLEFVMFKAGFVKGVEEGRATEQKLQEQRTPYALQKQARKS